VTGGELFYVNFHVPGIPRPQGSKDAFVDPSTGKARVRESAKGVEAWRDDIRLIANTQMRGRSPVSFPVSVGLVFTFEGDPAGFKATAPDIDKLVRAVLDALGRTKRSPKGVVFTDDSLVVILTASKHYGPFNRCGVNIEVREVRR
jgi:Holliday junction resolvase RusA-like endonuclease